MRLPYETEVGETPPPGAAGTISGPSMVEQKQTGVVFSVAPVTNATGYSWSLQAESLILTFKQQMDMLIMIYRAKERE